MKQTGMLVGSFESKPLKETIWACLKVFVTHKGDQSEFPVIDKQQTKHRHLVITLPLLSLINRIIMFSTIC